VSGILGGDSPGCESRFPDKCFLASRWEGDCGDILGLWCSSYQLRDREGRTGALHAFMGWKNIHRVPGAVWFRAGLAALLAASTSSLIISLPEMPPFVSMD